MISRLKQKRLNAGLKQAELAEAIGRHRNTIVVWEANPGVMQVKDLKAVAKALNCNPQELVEWEEIDE